MAGVEESIDNVEKISEFYYGDIERSLLRFSGLYEGYLDTLDEGAEVNRGDIENMLYTAGYFAAVGAFLNAGYQEIIEVSANLNNTILGTAVEFSDESLNYLVKTKHLDLSQFAKLGDDAVEILQRGATNLSLGIGNKEQLIRQLNVEVLPKFAHHSKTWVNTAASSMQAESTILLAKDAGIEKFTYEGPQDGKTRVFCGQNIGKTKTLAEWDAMDNQSDLQPVSIYRGGWNCRHALVPVEPEKTEESAE